MAVFSFSSGERKRRPRGDWKSQERSAQLRHAMEAIIHLELYPRSQIDVFVEVLQVDGSDYCASVNAATLALIDSGIPIKVYEIFLSFYLFIFFTEYIFHILKKLNLFTELCDRLYCNSYQYIINGG